MVRRIFGIIAMLIPSFEAAAEQWREAIGPESAVVLVLERSPATSVVDGPGSEEWQHYSLLLDQRGDASWLCWRYRRRSQPMLAWTSIVSAKSDEQIVGVRLGAGDVAIALVLIDIKARVATLYWVASVGFQWIERSTGNSIQMTKSNRLEIKDGDGKVHWMEFGDRQVVLDGRRLPTAQGQTIGRELKDSVVIAIQPFTSAGPSVSNRPSDAMIR